MANIILQTKIKHLSPILWYGQNVVDKYIDLSKILSSKLGSEYALLLAQPQLSENAINGFSTAIWLSDHVSSNARKITELDQTSYTIAKEQLDNRLATITNFYTELLLSEKDENVKWGQLIRKAVQFPDESHVYFENGKVVVTAWGFKLNNPSAAITGYSKEIVTVKDPPPEPVIDSQPPPAPTLEEEIEKEEEQENTDPLIDESVEIAESPDNTEETDHGSNGFEDSIEDKDSSQTKSSDGVAEQQKKEFFLKKYWWILLLLLLGIIAYLLFQMATLKKSNGLPTPNEDEIEIGQAIPPVDPVTIVSGPDSITNIVADRLNIALHGQNKDIEAFCIDFKKVYPEAAYSIIYKDPKTARVQIQFPSDELMVVKNSIESKIPDYDLLIWHENIFQNNSIQLNDPGFSDRKKSWYFNEVQAKEAWEITQGEEEVVIAILDSGFDTNHPELKDKLYKPWDVTTQSASIQHHKEHSIHGTHVASISAANANNQSGVAGIAPNCKIMPVKVGDSNGTLASTFVIDGFLYALNNGADVINMSLGLYVHPAIEHLPESAQKEIIKNKFKDEEAFWGQLFDIALANNTTVVLAGGNQNVLIGIDPLDRSNYPIRVSATNIKGTKADFSNWGDYSDVSAPGDEIYNAVGGNQSYNFLSGTSMAAPIVAGAVALLKSVKKDLKPSAIKQILKSTGKVAFAPAHQRIGNIIQIKDALTYTKTGKLPENNCSNVQAKIDSLNREIEKLKLECSRNINYDTLQFPTTPPTSTDFAKGRWKSTSPLLNAKSKEPVELYFDINNTSQGTLTLVEKNGTMCNAILNVTLNQNQLIFDQANNAVCDDTSAYNAYWFSCKADNKGNAVCMAKNKTTSKKDVNFLLVRIK